MLRAVVNILTELHNHGYLAVSTSCRLRFPANLHFRRSRTVKKMWPSSSLSNLCLFVLLL